MVKLGSPDEKDGPDGGERKRYRAELKALVALEALRGELSAEPVRAKRLLRPGVADITFVPTATGFLYLAVVLDAWSRKPDAERQPEIVGWSMANHLRAELLLDAVEMVIGQRSGCW